MNNGKGDSTEARAAALDASIITAMDELEKEGRPITIREVRTKVPGSNSTLLEPVRRLKAEREARAQEAASAPDVPDALQKSLRDIWTMAWQEADKSASEARKGYAARLAGKDSEIAELEVLVREAEEERDVAIAQTADITKENAALRTNLDAALKDADELRQALKEAWARLTERDEILSLLSPGRKAPQDAGVSLSNGSEASSVGLDLPAADLPPVADRASE